MFFLNLSFLQFGALLGTLASVVVTLYLLDKVRKRHTVSTLRFFQSSDKPPELKHRRRLQQPWSLLLQLLSLLLLLLAIAQLRLGSPDRSSRDHVMILDSSAWMAARAGQNRLIDQERLAARNYLARLPASDRVMVVRADALITPATRFESDRAKLRLAIDQTQPGSGALNLEQALHLAERAQRLQTQQPGEIVFIGSGRIGTEDVPENLPRNLRVIPIESATEHTGIVKMGARRSAEKSDTWDIFVSAKNYGTTAKSVPLGVQFGGAVIGARLLDLPPGAEQSASFEYSTRAAGWLEARLVSNDIFPGDHRALLELPPTQVAQVTVFSDEPALLEPVFHAIPNVHATFLPASRYAASTSGIVVLDRFAPAAPPSGPALWIAPPADRSPIPVQNTASKVKLKQWRSDHPLGAGLHTKDLELDTSEVFRPTTGDVVVADSDAGPVIVGRQAKSKMVVLGFHPVRSAMRYELATPLLFANILRWMEPSVFRSFEITAGTVGTVNVELEGDTNPTAVRVVTENGRNLPFTLQGRTLRFFSETPGVVRVLVGDRELVYSLTLPQPGNMAWSPVGVRRGLPPRASTEPASRDLWQWLTLLAVAALVADWILFGRARGRFVAASPTSPASTWRKAS